MDITWFGHNCFRIVERGRVSIVTDPYNESLGLPMPKLKGDVVTISQDQPHANFAEAVKGCQYVLDKAGEYEIGGAFIYALALHTMRDGQIHRNIGYVFKYDELSVVHLGSLSHVPGQATLETIGEVHVALVPVGGGDALKASAAAEVIALLEPSYIIPMHYAIAGTQSPLDPVDKFLKEMGISKVQEEDMLRLTSATMPEQPQVVLLKPQL